jgi:cysteinyl-tRNA synthetase
MKLFDTLAGELRDFTPLQKGKVTIYVCGPTVQSAPHIGHLRSALAYDLLVRWLAVLGNQVTLVRNVTDIDDKVLEKAQELGRNWWEVAYENEQLFASDYRRLGLLTPNLEPRATGHIPQMISLIQQLLDGGNAYQVNGSVYFDTGSWPSYGELTNQDPAAVESEEKAEGKKAQQDFALWKAHRPHESESAAWNSPFGKGRPGWHIECSAMSAHYLGKEFDIHGGGLDLSFPHHENELAQSKAAGQNFARFWIHNGLVTVSGQKMSKSLGNTVASGDLFALARPVVVRYYLASAHYRSVLDYQPSVLAEVESALKRLHQFLERAARELSETQFAQIDSDVRLPEDFVKGMTDDLNIPEALAVIHQSATEGNRQLDQRQWRKAANHRSAVNQMLMVLGLAPSQWPAEQTDEHRALDRLVLELIRQREVARQEKNFELADSIRGQLEQSGIELFDSPSGTHWRLS